MTEFNLSEKIGEIGNASYFHPLNRDIKPFDDYDDVLLTKDVKEFIRLLKEEVSNIHDTHIRYGKMTRETDMRFKDIQREINKLAGEKLDSSNTKDGFAVEEVK